MHSADKNDFDADVENANEEFSVHDGLENVWEGTVVCLSVVATENLDVVLDWTRVGSC